MTENLISGDALAALAPELVTPGVIFLCSDDAPNGVVLQAQGGQFSVACIVENQGLDLGVDASAEDIGDNWAQISDLTGAEPRGMLQLSEM